MEMGGVDGREAGECGRGRRREGAAGGRVGRVHASEDAAGSTAGGERRRVRESVRCEYWTVVKRGEPLSVLGISERRFGACDLISMAPAAARTTRSAGDIPVTPAVTPLTTKQKAAAKKRAEKAARNQQLAEESSAAAEIATAEALLRTPIRPLQRPGSKLTDEQLNMLIELSVTLDKKAGEGGFTQDTMKDLMLHGLAPPDQTPRTDNRARTAPLDADLMIVAVTSDKYVTALADRYTADRLQRALSRPEYEQFPAGKGCMASSHVLSGYLRSCMADQNPSQSTVAFALLFFFWKAHLIDQTNPRRHSANPPKEIHRVKTLRRRPSAAASHETVVVSQ